MASGPEKLASDFEEVQKTLELYPSINIIQVEGDPPDNYEIEYLLNGYVRDVDGNVRQGAQHRIRVSLPFGYPHFPPAVKPLTSIFHPDIDPDAIRIATYWQGTPQLPELIIYIGEMICGNNYNLDDPFNQDAADWYAEHLNELPLDSVQVGDIEPDETFDEEDDTFDLLGLDDLDDEQPNSLNELDEQLNLVRLRIEQKEMVAAGELLAAIPETTHIPDREEIEHVISSSLRESNRLIIEAEKLEESGAIKEALELTEKIAAIAADTPGLEDLRLRLGQAQVLSESFADDSTSPQADALSSAPPSPPSEAGSAKATKADLKPSTAKIKTAGLPVKPIIAGIILLTGLTGTGLLYFKDGSALKQAENKLQQAKQLAANKQFKGAEQAAQASVAPLKTVFLRKTRKKELQNAVTTLLNTTEFKQGVLGKALYNHQYLPIETVRLLHRLDKITQKGDDLLKTGKIRKAITAYEEAQKFARVNKLEVQEEAITQTINNLRFEETLATARQAENAQEWENAATTYKRALEIAQTLSDTEGTSEISKKLAAATFRHELDQSKATFTEAQWQKTIEMLQDARRLLNESPDTVSPAEQRELDRLLADSRLYQLLSLARHSYETRKWGKAIDEYQQSLNLLRTKSRIFAGSHDQDIPKIEKTLLMIKIAREQGAATRAEQKDDIRLSLDHYKAIRNLIEASNFQKDSDIKTITKNVLTQIKDKTAKLSMNSRVQWLKNNFESIFHKAYPSSRSSKLSHPKVTFLREKKGKQYFNLSCVERNRGSSFRLEVNYKYNLATGKWSIYYN
jgi:ubiquitin-protein ligase